jgi:hypothetical protein
MDSHLTAHRYRQFLLIAKKGLLSTSPQLIPSESPLPQPPTLGRTPFSRAHFFKRRLISKNVFIEALKRFHLNYRGASLNTLNRFLKGCK